MSNSTSDDALMLRIQRNIAQSEARMAALDKMFWDARKPRWDRFLPPVIALGGLAVGALGLLVAFVRH